MAYKTIGQLALDRVMEHKAKYELKEFTMLELIVDYCEASGEDPAEIGDDLKRDKEFTALFKADLIHNNQARFSGEKQTQHVDEWL